jgi:hypothetical protein
MTPMASKIPDPIKVHLKFGSPLLSDGILGPFTMTDKV